VDVTEFTPQAGRTHSPDAPVTIGVICALRPEKDLDTLLDAFAVVRRAGGNVRLFIIGSGPGLPGLRARAEALGIAGDCTFEPATSQVADWLRTFDVFVLPSRSEALSNSLMEAMACGCSVIASRVGGNVELVQHDRTGLLFESGNLRQLSDCLQTLVTDQERRVRLGAAAAALMREDFSLPKAAARMGEIYSTLLD
jgi:glycosyltransferase involved in cell wall biosynthesis